MKNTLKYLLLFSIISIPAFSGFGFGGMGKAMQVEEIGTNVKMNTMAKVEQAKATLEAIEQTKNQIIQLKNDALNLNKWAGEILNSTLGITQNDVNTLLQVQSLTNGLIGDVKNFEKNWKNEFKVDYRKMSLQDLFQNQDDLYKNIEKQKMEIMSFEEGRKTLTNKIIDNVSKFNMNNRNVSGNLQAMQLANEIASANYAAIKNLELTIRETELNRVKEKELENNLKKQNDAIAEKELYRKLKENTYEYRPSTVYKYEFN